MSRCATSSPIRATAPAANTTRWEGTSWMKGLGITPSEHGAHETTLSARREPYPPLAGEGAERSEAG